MLVVLRMDELERSRNTVGLSEASLRACTCSRNNGGELSANLGLREYGVLCERGDGSGTAPSGIARYRWGLGERRK